MHTTTPTIRLNKFDVARLRAAESAGTLRPMKKGYKGLTSLADQLAQQLTLSPADRDGTVMARLTKAALKLRG